MRPAHGNLRHTQPMAFCQKQNLGVEPEMFHALLLKNNPRPANAKCLEPELCVEKLDPNDPLQEGVKENPRLFADDRLVDFDKTTVDCTGADCNIITAVLQRLEQLAGFLD